MRASKQFAILGLCDAIVTTVVLNKRGINTSIAEQERNARAVINYVH